jgi:hypothetical protein
MSLAVLYWDAKLIYRKHGLRAGEGRKGLAKKGVELGGKFAVKEEIRRRLVAGERPVDIALGMGMKVGVVRGVCERIYREEGVRGGREGLREKNSELRSQNSGVGIQKSEVRG